MKPVEIDYSKMNFKIDWNKMDFNPLKDSNLLPNGPPTGYFASTPLIETIPKPEDVSMKNFKLADDFMKPQPSFLDNIVKALDPKKNGVADALDPKKNGVADAFDPNKNGLANFFKPDPEPEPEDNTSNLLLLGAGGLLLLFVLMN